MLSRKRARFYEARMWRTDRVYVSRSTEDLPSLAFHHDPGREIAQQSAEPSTGFMLKDWIHTSHARWGRIDENWTMQAVSRQRINVQRRPWLQ